MYQHLPVKSNPNSLAKTNANIHQDKTWKTNLPLPPCLLSLSGSCAIQ
jgi:hypothetical protein